MNMAEKIAKVGVEKVGGYLYFVDEEGDVARKSMEDENAQQEKVAVVGIVKKPENVYFIDEDGDISVH
jgi:hypothetical protein